MAAASNGHVTVHFAGQPDGGGDIGRRSGLSNDPGTSVNVAVPHALGSDCIEVRVVSRHHSAREPITERLEICSQCASHCCLLLLSTAGRAVSRDEAGAVSRDDIEGGRAAQWPIPGQTEKPVVDRSRRPAPPGPLVAGLGGLRRLYLILALAALCVNRRPRDAGNRLWPTVAAGRWPLTSS